MCDPVAIVTGALAVGGAVANHEAQRKASKANAAAARKAMRTDLQTLGVREGQEREAAAQRVTSIRREEQSALGLANVSAAESGVAGSSVQAVLDDIAFKGSEAATTAIRNLDAILEQVDRERAGVRAGAQSRLAAVPAPSIIGAGLQAGAGVVDAYSNYLIRKTPSGS